MEAGQNPEALGHCSQPEQARAAFVARMKEYEPSDELQFLMALSIEPVAAKLRIHA
jgi:hypothetical protein